MATTTEESPYSGIWAGMMGNAGRKVAGISTLVGIIALMLSGWVFHNLPASVLLGLAAFIAVYGPWMVKSFKKFPSYFVILILVGGKPNRVMKEGGFSIIVNNIETPIPVYGHVELSFGWSGVYSERTVKKVWDVDDAGKKTKRNRVNTQVLVKLMATVYFDFGDDIKSLSLLYKNGPPELWKKGIDLEEFQEILRKRLEDVILPILRKHSHGKDFLSIMNQRAQISTAVTKELLETKVEELKKLGIKEESIEVEILHVDEPEELQKAMAAEAASIPLAEAEVNKARGSKKARILAAEGDARAAELAAEGRAKALETLAKAYGVPASEVPDKEAQVAAASTGRGVYVSREISLSDLFGGTAKPKKGKKKP